MPQINHSSDIPKRAQGVFLKPPNPKQDEISSWVPPGVTSEPTISTLSRFSSSLIDSRGVPKTVEDLVADESVVVVAAPDIDRFGREPCAAQIQAILDTDEAKGGRVIFPPGFYALEHPLTFYTRTRYIGSGSNSAPRNLPLGTDYLSGTCFFPHSTYNYEYPTGGPVAAIGDEGSTIIYAAIDPTTEGSDGDFYVNTATDQVFGPKAGGTWPTGTGFVGRAGEAGTTVLYGAVDPTTEGSDGDYYINTATDKSFGPKAGGSWSATEYNVVGPAGPTMLIKSETWDHEVEDDPWMHWFGVENMNVTGTTDTPVDYGMAIHTMGEVAYIRDFYGARFKKAQLFLSGSHAPCNLSNLTLNGEGLDIRTLASEYDSGSGAPREYNPPPLYPDACGLWLGLHPVLSGNSGDVLINDLSGDQNRRGLVRSSGACNVTAISPKLEHHGYCSFLFDGGSSGGAAPGLHILGGYSQDPSASEVNAQFRPAESIIRIEDNTKPTITMIGFRTTAFPTNFDIDYPNGDTHAAVDVFGYETKLIADWSGSSYLDLTAADEWSDASVSYVVGDEVRYNGTAWTCNSNHVSAPSNAPGTVGDPWDDNLSNKVSLNPGHGSFGNPIITYGNGRSFFGNSITLGFQSAIYGQRSDGETRHAMLQYASDQIVKLTAGSGSGLALRDSSEVTQALIDNDGVELEDTLQSYRALTVAGLPAAASNTRKRLEVSDATTPTLGAPVSGGGAVPCEVRSDGTNWIVIDDGSNW